MPATRDNKIEEVTAKYLVPPSAEEVFAAFDGSLTALAKPYLPLAEAFRHNANAAWSTVAMPFTLAFAGVQRMHFQRFHLAAMIRGLAAELQAPEAREERALAQAQKKLEEFGESDGGRERFIEDTTEFLLRALEADNGVAARELLSQGLVLVWSAFEVFFRDSFEAVLNAYPEKVKALMAHPSTRKRFEAERLRLDTLVEHGFDLSQRLGSVLVAQQDFSDLPCVRATYEVLYPSAAGLRDALAARELWGLFQRRHLVVHRRGIVDRAYLGATGDTAPLGTRLNVSPNDFENALRVVVAAGTELVRALSTSGPSGR